MQKIILTIVPFGKSNEISALNRLVIDSRGIDILFAQFVPRRIRVLDVLDFFFHVMNLLMGFLNKFVCEYV